MIEIRSDLTPLFNEVLEETSIDVEANLIERALEEKRIDELTALKQYVALLNRAIKMLEPSHRRRCKDCKKSPFGERRRCLGEYCSLFCRISAAWKQRKDREKLVADDWWY